MRLRTVGCISALVAAVFLSGCSKKKSSAGTKLGDSETWVLTEGGKPEYKNENYQFAFKGLGEQWKILSGIEAESINPDATAVAVRAGGIYGAIIVEPIESDITQYEELIKSNISSNMMNVEWSDTESVKLAGKDAHRFSAKAVTDGISIKYDIALMMDRGYGYQLISWLQDGGSKEKYMDEFFDSFVLLEGEIVPPELEPLPDYVGVGRRVKDGRFESPIYRLAATAPPGWRIFSEMDLKQNTEDAELGLEHGPSGILLTVVTERINEAQKENYMDAFKNEIAQLASAPPEGMTLEPKQAIVDGKEFTLHPIYVINEVPIMMYAGVIRNGPIHYRVSSWHITDSSKNKIDTVIEGLSGLTFLSEEEAGSISDELKKSPDPQTSLGPTHSLRNGVYRDFEAGIEWTKSEGFWRISAGDEARLSNPDVSLYAFEMANEIYMQLISEEALSFDDDSYHELISNSMSEGPGMEGPFQMDPVEVDGKSCKLAKFIKTLDEGLRLSMYVCTTVRNRYANQLIFWAINNPESNIEELIHKAISGYRFPGKKLKPSISNSNSYEDIRVGYKIVMPSGSWKLDKSIIPQLDPMASSIKFTGKDSYLMIIGINIGDVDRANVILNQIMDNIMRINLDKASSSGASHATTKIDGIDAKVLSANVENEHLKVATLSNGGTVYMVLVSAEKSKDSEQLFKQATTRLKFLD